MIPIVGTEFFPSDDTGSVSIQIDIPVGSTVETTNAVVSKLEDIFNKKVLEKVVYLSRSGQSSGRFGGMSGQKESFA